MRTFIQIATLLALLSYDFALAQTSENPYGDNFRERCRKLVSGAFAESWNETNRANDGVISAQKVIKRIQPQQEQYNKELASIEKKLQKENYDPQLIQRRDEIVAQIKLYHEQLLASEDQLNHAKKSAADAKARHQKIDATVRKIFSVSFVEDPEGLPRKVFHQLTWKTPCPKYRTLCPLPATEAAILKDLATKVTDTDKDCRRYAALK